MKKVSVVILNWNGINLLKNHFRSILNQNYDNYEIIFVDNNSKDESVEFINKIKKDFKHIPIKIHINKSNLGTAEGSNSAIHLCSGEYLLFLSNDMDFENNLISKLINLTDKYNDFGCGSVKFLTFKNGKKTDVIDSFGAETDFMLAANSNYIGFENSVTSKIIDKEVGFVFGGCLLIKKNIFELVGMYDKEYFTLTDDIDLCLRVRLLGLKIYVTNESHLYHRVSATLSKSNRHIKRFYSERNNLRTILKCYNLKTIFMILPLYLALLVGESIFFACMLKFKIAMSPYRSIIWNLARLGSTINKRKKIQKFRKINDLELINKMNKMPEKIKHFIDFTLNFNKPRWKNFF